MSTAASSHALPGQVTPSRVQDLISRGIHHRRGPVRKATRLLMAVAHAIHCRCDTAERRALAPPVLANSVPKSGTHLLDQVVAALPHRRCYGTFLESMTASYVFRERTDASTVAFIEKLVSGEVVRAHLHHSTPAQGALAEQNVVHYFIYRDPRDVVVSEAHYLRSMNLWHKLHPYFKRLPTFTDAVSLAIRGLQPGEADLEYPDIARRYRRFLPWLHSPAVCAVRFEELVSPRRRGAIERIVRFYADRCGEPFDIEEVVDTAEARIAPSRSHTYRAGKTGGWGGVFTDEHKQSFKSLSGGLLGELGYESSADW